MVENERNAGARQNRTLWFVAAGCATIVICMICAAALAAAAFFWLPPIELPFPAETEEPQVRATPTEHALAPDESEIVIDLPTRTPEQATPIPTATPTPLPGLLLLPPPEIDQRPVSATAWTNLEQLFAASYPYQDYYATARRLGSLDLGERTVTSSAYSLNDRQSFHVEGGRINATLLGITDHIYLWVEDGLELDKSTLMEVAERLELELYPRIVRLFGQEWQPGMDNDPHLSVLHLVGSTSATELGYFTNVDEYPRSLYPESNEQEIVYMNMAQLVLGSDLYYGTLVHELQHLIQWYVDPNETTWMNEGLSQLAELYLGYDTVDTYDYSSQPEIQLNSWSYDEGSIDAHYAAAYLYVAYLWEQLGESAMQELSRHPANGLAAVRTILQGYQPDRDLDQLTAEWIAANFLDDPAAGPRYYYREIDISRPDYQRRLREVPVTFTDSLDQFGTHFIDLDFRGKATISFAGDTIVDLIDAPSRTGETMWYAPGIDETNAQLTAAFDLSAVESATLKFSTWYELEDDFDFAYVAVSVDGGASWDLLMPDHSSVGEFGPAFNGRSAREPEADSGWVKESIPLNDYVGQVVHVRFEVVTDFETDDSGSGRGFAIDDLSIPEIGYAASLEDGEGGWRASGFTRTGWQIPQKWIVQYIEDGPNPTVTQLSLAAFNQGQWQVEVGKGNGTLAITPITPFTDEAAAYWVTIEETLD